MHEIYYPAEDSYLLSKVIVRQISKILKKRPEITLLEIGCGSGLQLNMAYKTGIKKKNILGTDINPQAVKHCKNLGFNCIKSDLFENIKDKYDLIVFNPPYLPEDKREPASSRLATTGGRKGGEIINKFLKKAKKHLAKNGKIFLLTSSLTKGLNFLDYRKKLLDKKKLFYEELYVWELVI